MYSGVYQRCPGDSREAIGQYEEKHQTPFMIYSILVV